MPWYRMGGNMVHLNLGRRKNAPPPCPFFRWETRKEPREAMDGTVRVVSQRVRVRCMCITTVLCDWPGCDAPMCEQHALKLGPDLDVCPTHNHRKGLLSRLLPAPKENSNG